MARLTLVAFVVTGASAAGPLWPNVCAPGDSTSKLPFCDTKLSLDKRAADLVSRMTLDEKQSILGNTASAVPRLGIPAYQWWSEGLHGPLEPCVTDGGVTKCPTDFPAASAMAAAFNDTLYRAAGSVVGVEGRSISNVRHHDNKIGDGLTYWAPNSNMERDPRWGRNQEAPGEDPHLTSRYIANYVRGMQEGEDAAHVQMVATCKHFLANSLEHSTINGKVITRHNFDALIPLPELVDYYLPGFQSCVQDGKALGIMCSYNAVNGVPMCANRDLLTDTLRGEWGFDGYVTSDCGAVADINSNHHFVPDDPTAAALGLDAGCDTDCGGVYSGNVVKAVNRSILSEKTVDLSLQRLAKIQMRLGLFEDKSSQTYFDKTKYGINQIDTPEHQQLALEAAQQSIVLLKNDYKALPLLTKQHILLVGPHVNGNEVFMSNYHGSRCADGKFDCIPSPLEVITKVNVGGTTTAIQGVEVNSKMNNIQEAVDAAKTADTIVMMMGIDGSQEGEEHDRYNCTLPGLQTQLVQEIAALGRRAILVLVHGGAMCIGDVKDSSGVPAIIDAFYGGERASEALASVLFGSYNPSGKLPVTMYPAAYLDENPLTQMSVTAPPGRTHLYYTGTPEYAFGTGLSFSTWKIEMLSNAETRLSSSSDPGKRVYSVRLTNQGPLAGQQRVLAFARPKIRATATAPRQRFWGYQGAELAVGESAIMNFTLDVKQLAVANEVGDRVAYPGQYEIAFSDGSHEIATSLQITGEPFVAVPSFFRKAPPASIVV